MLHKHCTEGDAPEFFAIEKGIENTGQSVGKNGIHSKNTCKFKFGVLTFEIHPIDKTSQKQTNNYQTNSNQTKSKNQTKTNQTRAKHKPKTSNKNSKNDPKTNKTAIKQQKTRSKTSKQ